MSDYMETKTVNFYGEMFKLNKINDELWISDATDQEECLVFELCEGTWYRSFYTTDEIESEFDFYSYHLTDDMIDQILSDTDDMLNYFAENFMIKE